MSTTAPHEHIEDLTAHEWCNALLSDPTVTHISKRHIPDLRKGVSNSFFTRTLFTDGAIRACVTLYRPGKGNTREIDETIIFTGSAPNLDIEQSTDRAAELQRQLAKVEVAYDPADPDSPEIILLVSIGSDIDGGMNRLHGGVTASLLDQTMGTLLSYYYQNTSATSELKVKYKKAIETPCVLKVRAKLLREKGRWINTWGAIEDSVGNVFAEGEGAFVLNKLAESKI